MRSGRFSLSLTEGQTFSRWAMSDDCRVPGECMGRHDLCGNRRQTLRMGRRALRPTCIMSTKERAAHL